MSRHFFLRALLPVLCLVLLIGAAAESAVPEISGYVIPDGKDALSYGHICIDIPADSLYELFSQGDSVEVDLGTFGIFEAPVCGNYEDVDPGCLLLRAKPGSDHITFAVNYGHIALDVGLVEETPDGAEKPYAPAVDEDIEISVRITLRAKGEARGNVLGGLVRTNDREDYPELTDEQFANFRMIGTTGIAEGRLYRSSSPIDPAIARNGYADAAAGRAGVKSFIDLSDAEASAATLPGYAESYYAAQSHIFQPMTVAFLEEDFRGGVAECCRFMIAHEGPYLIHCVEGKDRTGIFAAVLECLMGANLDEAVNDYTETYRNFYSVEDGRQRALTTEEEDALRELFVKNLSLLFDAEIGDETDLAKEAEGFLADAGMTAEEIGLLREKLG